MNKVGSFITPQDQQHRADADQFTLTMTVRHAIALNGLLGCLTLVNTDNTDNAEDLLAEVIKTLGGLPRCNGAAADLVKQRGDGQIFVTAAFESAVKKSADFYQEDREED